MQKNYLKGKKFLIIGLGKTGRYTLDFLKGKAGSILAVDTDTDIRLSPDHARISIVLDEGINSDLGLLKDIDIVVISPGVENSIPLVLEAEKRGIPVISEIELAFLAMARGEKDKTIAVTGTNGKTTVVTLIDRFLKASGIRSIPCGNIGMPLIGTMGKSGIIRVIEVSSFQLERIYGFKPHLAVLLNITSDHIDRHQSFQNYKELKFRLFKNQDEKDIGIFNIDDQNIKNGIGDHVTGGQALITFSLDPDKKADIYNKKGIISYDIEGNKGEVDIRGISLKGDHNISNIMASLAASMIMGADIKRSEESLRTLEKLDHRNEFLGLFKGIRCFNDSKSTNPDATVKALSGFGKEVTLIAGGRDKDMDFSVMTDSLDEHVKNLMLVGENKDKISRLLEKRKNSFSIFKFTTLEEAVEVSFDITDEKDVILLSPASASMDMFRDYRHRGDVFKKLVYEKR